jgi:hypothetical protein
MKNLIQTILVCIHVLAAISVGAMLLGTSSAAMKSQDVQGSDQSPTARSILRLGDNLCALEVRRPTWPSAATKEQLLVLGAHEVTGHLPVPSYEGSFPVMNGPTIPMSTIALPGGGWIATGSYHRGGSRAMLVWKWSLAEDGAKPTWTSIVKHELVYDLPPVSVPVGDTFIPHLPDAPEGDTVSALVRQLDISNPVPLIWDGEVFVAGDSYGAELWVTPLFASPAEFGIDGAVSIHPKRVVYGARRAGKGRNPRVLSSDTGECIMVAQQLKPHVSPGPLMFQRSEDLREWQPMEEVPASPSVGADYDVLRREGRVWLVFTTPQERRIKVWRWNEGEPVWEDLTGLYTNLVPTDGSRLWLVDTPERPRLVFVTAEGEYRITDL